MQSGGCLGYRSTAGCTCIVPHGPLVSLLLLPQSAYEAFMKTQPELEAFEAELKKYMAIETEVSNISMVYNIGEQAPMHECMHAHMQAGMHCIYKQAATFVLSRTVFQKRITLGTFVATRLIP